MAHRMHGKWYGMESDELLQVITDMIFFLFSFFTCFAALAEGEIRRSPSSRAGNGT